MAGGADSAVGAILEIPDDLLTKIKEAENKIKSLGRTSENVANEVSNHWGQIAPSGLQTFIEKIAQAREVMQKLGNGKFELQINTQPFEQSMANAANAAKKTTNDVSETVQALAIQSLDFTNINRLRESLDGLDATYNQVIATIKKLESGRATMATESTEAQATTNMIQLLKEYIELKKKSEEQQKAKTTVFDQNILDEQKTTLQQILQYQKDINTESKKQERVTKLGGTISQEDTDRLKDYKEKLDRLTESYDKLKVKIGEMSEAGQKRFNAADVSHELAMSRELTSSDEKRGQALQMVSKYLSDIKLKSAGISSREEGVYMNELVGVYQQMIAMIKKRGEVEAQVASQGYAQTSAQTNLLQTIQAEYDRLNASLANVTGKYTEIDNAVKNAFGNAKTMQEAENAAKLADALQKAADAAEKKRKAEAKTEQTDLSKDRTEYKRVLSLIEQIEKAQRKVNEALASAALPANLAQQLQSSQAAAEATLNNLHNRQKELEAKRGQELIDIHQQNEAKKGAAAVAEHEKAEKEKTRITRQEATDRYNAEMRQARLQNQALTAQGKQQRISITDAREQRAIELAEQRKREVERLRQEIDKLDKTDVNYQRDLDRLNQRINELLGTTQRRVSYTKEEAMAMAKSAYTLREYENAYKALKDAMATTNPKSKEWQEMNTQLQKAKTNIDEIKKKMGEFQKQSVAVSGVVGQLRNQIAAAFSVGAINGFIKKMVETRAQFELQRVALGAILQDKDKADKIFLQVQQMALESPFSIMQLERATKQIAAFGFEADKLKPTLKMLADMSAGLGVEIDRLVLVMGHLKARNYLEGTMVRQFTNAGFNVLGELAKYYTELEGRMVSVAEVQTRVKKKMVEFGDVEEVLKRVTSAGGMFYDMQKKQSDSLWGQMQRITDAYDLMLNEIGKDNQNMISKALTAIRSLINSWRSLAPMIKDLGYAMAAVFAVKGVRMLLTSVTALGAAFMKLPKLLATITDGIKTMNLAWSTTGVGLLVTALITAVEIFRGARAEANALREELNRIGDESVKSVNESIANFKGLADTLSDASKSYEERNKALQELKRIYHDVLPQEKLEWDYIVGLNGNYKELTKSIVDYYSAKEYQHKYEAVMGSKQAKDVTDELERAYKRMNKEGALGMIFPENQIKEWANKVATELNTGKIPSSVEALAKRTREIFGENIDVSKYITEAYRKADFTDVIDKVEKVKKEVNDLSVGVPLAENAVMGLNESFDNMDAGAATQRFEDIKDRIQSVTDSIKQLSSLPENQEFYKNQKIAQYQAELNSLNVSLDAVAEARAKIIAQDVKNKIEEEIKVLTDLVTTWWKNKMAMESLVLQGEQNTKAYRDLETAQRRIVESAPDLESKFGVKIPWAMIQSTQTTYDLQQQLDTLSNQAFPKAAESAKAKMSEVELAVLNAKGAMDSFLSGLSSLIPESWANGFNKFAQSLGFTSTKAEEAKESMESIYSDLAKKRADQFGADISEINKIIDKNLTRGEAAKKLREKAEELKKILKSYDTSTAQTDWLKLENKTEQGIAQMRKDVQAIEALATDLDGVNDKAKKGASGKDMVLDMWKRRTDAVKRYYDGAEKARKNLSEVESKEQQIYSFTKLWDELGLNSLKGLDLNTLLSQGFNPDYLKDQYVEALKILKDAVPEKYDELRKDIEKAIASESIEIQFKIAQGERERLQQSISDMFDNYALTKELSKLGVGVDLTYMVGGKPTTLADIRREYERLMVDFADKSEEMQKIITKMGEDLQKRELDNRKQQLNNYVKYLTESMGERARIEIKAYQEINKIREDESLDSFSKEQAIMQRRRKMYEDLSKFDLGELKGSDVYLTVFKDLETASKEQLQFVINKLKEMQSTFKDLSPAQVKSIANDLKKMEDALASKDSVRNLSTNLFNAIRYARQRNDLLKEQTDLQDRIFGAEKMLTAAESYLNDLSIRRKSIQDESSDEWQEANSRVKDQQELVRKLQEEIAALKKELGLVTDEIDAGNLNWNKFKKGLSEVRSGMSQLKESFDAVFDGLDSVGLVNDAFRDVYDSIGDIIGGLDTFIGGLESMDIQKPFSIITGGIKAIGGMFQSIGGIFGIGDKKKERQIKKLQDKVESLDKAYQKLEKSIESAYTFDDYNAGYKQMQDTLAAEKTAYEEVIRLEEAKKKTDNEKIKEYKAKLEEIAEAEDELRKSQIERFGSTEDVWSEANNWVDAWLDAYKEVGTGIDSLNESWDEFYENLVKKQATSAIVSRRMEGFISDINKAIEANMDEYGYVDAFKEIGERFKKEFGSMNEQLIEFFKYAGITGGNGELLLSDLQKGIQNITEPQAAAIEAYLNSMRFAVFRHTEQLDTLIATVQAQYGSGAENPVVTELKGIRGVLDNIYSTLRSVVSTRMGQTGIVIARS